MRETIVIPDLHGCLDEFNELLDVINYSKSKHRLVLLGDISDRGNNPTALIRKIREMELEMVVSNHEDKLYRWRKYEDRRKLTGEANPIKDPHSRRKDEWLALTDSDLEWIGSLPHVIELENNWFAIHGGLEWNKSIKDQKRDIVIRNRIVDKDGNHVKLKNGEDKPAGMTFWAEVWNRPQNIVFGHTVFKDSPRIFKNENNTCIGLDGGVVYGGSLVGYNLTQNSFVKIKAHKKYYTPDANL